MLSLPKGCLFLDSCIVFAEILQENSEVMEKLKLDVKRRNLPCFLSQSAKTECERKLKASQIFFEKVFRTFAKGYFDDYRHQQGRNPADPLSRDDFKAFASMFNELKKVISYVLQKPLRTLEIKMILRIEDILRGSMKVDFDSFLNTFIGEALLVSAHLKIQEIKLITNEQGFFKNSSVMPDASITAKLLANVQSSNRYPFHEDDANNISSAWSYMNSMRQKTVFTTFDFRTVLSHAEQIFNLIGLHCVDPLYAVHFL